VRRTENFSIRTIVTVLLLTALVVNVAYAVDIYLGETYSAYANRGGVAILRDSAILTTGYVATDSIQLKGTNNIGVFFLITKGSLTSVQYKFQFSADKVNWCDEVTESVASGVITVVPLYYTETLGAATVNFIQPIPSRGEWLRVSIKGTGTATGSLCEIQITGRAM